MKWMLGFSDLPVSPIGRLPLLWRASAISLVGLGGTTAPSPAVMLIGPDNNLEAPSNGAPWDHVARLDTTNASGVYVGNGYVLTANHVTNPETILLAGQLYSIDPFFFPTQVGGTDLKLVRIQGDPGLASLPLAGADDDHFGVSSTLIGWGVGKGDEIANQGWQWAGNDSRVERWGTNVTLAALSTAGETAGLLQTRFDFSEGFDEASATGGDSGSGLFQNFGGVWKLAGLTVSVDGSFGESFYDQDLAAPGDQPHLSYYVPIKGYRDELIAVIIPEPATALLLPLGAMCAWTARRQRRGSK